MHRDGRGWDLHADSTNGGNPRTITAAYSGNSQFNSSTGTKDHVVNACTQNTVVTSTADDGTAGTLRYIVANACEGSTITFDPTVFDPAHGPYVISLGTFGNIVGNLLIDKNLTIKGPGANILTVQRLTQELMCCVSASSTSLRVRPLPSPG